MTLLIDNRQSILTEDYQLFFEKAIQKTLDQLEIDSAVEVSLLLVDNQEIQQLNMEYREKDKATDVLSFPMLELDPFDRAAFIDILNENLDHGEVLLGDIVISVEKAIEQAKDYGHGVKRELGFLLVHGMLHLLGYDHEVDEVTDTTMVQLQENILNALSLTRE